MAGSVCKTFIDTIDILINSNTFINTLFTTALCLVLLNATFLSLITQRIKRTERNIHNNLTSKHVLMYKIVYYIPLPMSQEEGD